MARIRSIKPEFPQSESIGRLSRDARLLFIQLWTIVDDEGRARAASRMLASLLFPYDDDAPTLIGKWLDELEREGCVRRYLVDGSQYLDIPNWLKHQKIDKPSTSKLPPFAEPSRSVAEASRALAPDLGPRIKEKEEGSDADASGASAPPMVEDRSIAERELFARARQVLGPKCGGVVTNLLRAKGGNPALARAALEEASQKHDPAEFIGRILRPRQQPPSRRNFQDEAFAALDELSLPS